MLRIGITGQEGFVGSHLYNTLGLFPEQFSRVVYDIIFFKNDLYLDEFV